MYGLKPCGLTMYGKTQDEMLQRIEFAAELGIDTVVFDCEANYPDFVSRFLPPLVELRAKRGVRIAVENHLTVPFSADYCIWDIDRAYRHGVDGLNFGPGESSCRARTARSTTQSRSGR